MTNLKELAALESLWQLKTSLTISKIDLHINEHGWHPVFVQVKRANVNKVLLFSLILKIQLWMSRSALLDRVDLTWGAGFGIYCWISIIVMEVVLS